VFLQRLAGPGGLLGDEPEKDRKEHKLYLRELLVLFQYSIDTLWTISKSSLQSHFGKSITIMFCIFLCMKKILYA
jgi:hypothetical protein